MFAVFQNVCDLCIAVSVTSWLRKTDFYVVVAVFVHPDRGQPQGAFQFTRGAGIVLCTGTDNRGEVAFCLFQDDFAACFQNLLADFITLFPREESLMRKSSGIIICTLATLCHHLFCQHLCVHSTALYVLHRDDLKAVSV